MDEDEDELSDLDDDDVEDNEDTSDWLNEKDDPPLEQSVRVTPEKVKITDPFFVQHIDLYHALLDMEDLMFSTLEYSKQVELIQSVVMLEFSPGQELIEEGHVEDQSFFIVVASEATVKVAEVELITKTEDKDSTSARRLKRGQIFGHKFFISKQSQPRDYSAIIPKTSPCTVAVARVDEDKFDIWNNFRNVLLVRSVPLMQMLPTADRQDIINHMTIRTFHKDEYIIRQGDMGDEFFIIIEGSAQVIEDKVLPDGEVATVKLVTLREGHFFGEMSLILDEPRVASVVAVGQVVCLALVKRVFRAALSADIFSQVLQEVLDKRTKMRQQRNRTATLKDDSEAGSSGAGTGSGTGSGPGSVSKASMSKKSTSDDNDQVRVTSTLTLRKLGSGDKLVNKYLILNELGKGSFAEVFLCQDELTGIQYAMKIMARPAMKTFQDEIEEIAIMKKLKHENIVSLHEVIDDPNSRKIYIVQEYVAGGTLMPDAETSHPFSVDLARKYFRDVLKGIHYLHSKGIVHRDIKPQNLLVSADGVVKLADFGASVLTMENSGKMNAGGTPAFMAPELFQVSGTNPDGIDLHATDIWSLGITLYCMVMGRTPWVVGNQIELAHSVINTEITFPDESVDPHLKHLLREMLDRDFRTRIDLNGIISDEWVTQEGSDPLFTEQDILDDQLHEFVGHVLVIDENVASTNLIMRKLDLAHCSYTMAVSVDEAVAIVEASMQPDGECISLVLVEYVVEGMSGPRLVSRIRDTSYNGNVVGLYHLDQFKDPDEAQRRISKEFLTAGADFVWEMPLKSIDVVQLMQSAKSSGPLSQDPTPRPFESLCPDDVNQAIAVVAAEPVAQSESQEFPPPTSMKKRGTLQRSSHLDASFVCF